MPRNDGGYIYLHLSLTSQPSTYALHLSLGLSEVGLIQLGPSRDSHEQQHSCALTSCRRGREGTEERGQEGEGGRSKGERECA
eukprot:1311142-Rhodomonas_salina.2